MTKSDLETRVKEHFRNIKNWEIEKSAVAAHEGKEKHAIDRKTPIKQALNKLGKYPYNKKQRSHYRFWNPASRSFNWVDLKSSRGQQISSYKKFKPKSWVDNEEKFLESVCHISDVLCYKLIPIIFKGCLDFAMYQDQWKAICTRQKNAYGLNGPNGMETTFV